jgi:hypothetical protein
VARSKTLQVVGECLGDFLGCRGGAKARDHLTVPSDEEFRKIPGDFLFALFVGMPRLEELVELAGPVAVHFDLGEEREAGVIVGFDEFRDLFVAARFLTAELIAWEGENSKSRRFVFIV